MPLKVRNGSSAWSTASAIKVRNGSGGWSSVTNGYVRGPSGWQLFFGGAPNLPIYGGIIQDIELEHSYTDPSVPPGNSGEAYVEIVLFNTGSGAYRYGDSVTATTNFTTFTWLPTGGSVGNYYAYMDAPSGDAFTAGSDSTATSLVLSTTRIWRLLISANSPAATTKSLTSTLRIKDSLGNDLIARSLSMLSDLLIGNPI